MKKPVLIAFLDKEHPEYGEESIELQKTLETVAHEYTQFVFTYTEDQRYKAQKSKMGISWEEYPSITLNNVLTNEFFTFPRGKPFTVRNLKYFLNSLIDGSYGTKSFKIPDSYKEYTKFIKHATKLKPKTFNKNVMESSKDVAVLLYNSKYLENEETHTYSDNLTALKSFGKAASRFADLKIKSVRMATYNTEKNKLPEVLKQFESQELPLVVFVPQK